MDRKGQHTYERTISACHPIVISDQYVFFLPKEKHLLKEGRRKVP